MQSCSVHVPAPASACARVCCERGAGCWGAQTCPPRPALPHACHARSMLALSHNGTRAGPMGPARACPCSPAPALTRPCSPVLAHARPAPRPSPCRKALPCPASPRWPPMSRPARAVPSPLALSCSPRSCSPAPAHAQPSPPSPARARLRLPELAQSPCPAHGLAHARPCWDRAARARIPSSGVPSTAPMPGVARHPRVPVCRPGIVCVCPRRAACVCV